MASTAQAVTLPKYAQVAVPVHLSKTFTYRLPASMQRDVRLGSRVVVPLGRKPVTAYVVALLPALREGTSLIESEIKEVEQLLDRDPPLTPQVLEVTRWVADYYLAPWGEVMRAALPTGINASVEEVVSITAEGQAQRSAVRSQSNVKTRALNLLAAAGDLAWLSAFIALAPQSHAHENGRWFVSSCIRRMARNTSP